MNIEINDLGKRYNREWIFRHVHFQFATSGKYAITGPNGSGKSTLLQVIAGAILQSEGSINYSIGNETIKHPYKEIGIAAPYLDLIEEMTAYEMLHFHRAFKAFHLPISEILSAVGLSQARDKQIRYFSSGMKQRIKMALAFFSKGSVLLLDEPTTNLDVDGIEMYQRLLENYSANKLIIISSNDKNEYKFCDEVIDIKQYK